MNMYYGPSTNGKWNIANNGHLWYTGNMPYDTLNMCPDMAWNNLNGMVMDMAVACCFPTLC